MGLSIVTPATQEPISIAEMRDHLHITSTSEDGLLAGYILAAREWIEGQIHGLLVTQTLEYTIDYGWPCEKIGCYETYCIVLPVRPLASVTSVTYVDANGATQTLASNQYIVRTDVPAPYIAPVYNVTWPAVRSQLQAITVRFVAGWAPAEVPHSLLQAIRYLVAHFYATREAVTAGQQVTEVPIGLEAMISPHRNSRFM